MIELRVDTYNKIKTVVLELMQQLGREPLAEEVAVELSWNLDGVQEWLDFILDETSEEKTDEDFEIKIKYSFKNYEMQKARVRMGLEQKKLAEITGIGHMRICAIENCRAYPKQHESKKISEVLKLESSFLFPEWLNIIGDAIKEKRNKKILPIKQIGIDSPEILLIDSGENLYEQADKSLRKKYLEEALNKLPPKEKQILSMRMSGYTFEQVGRRLSVTRERIRQIESKALERLRNDDELLKKIQNENS